MRSQYEIEEDKREALARMRLEIAREAHDRSLRADLEWMLRKEREEASGVQLPRSPRRLVPSPLAALTRHATQGDPMTLTASSVHDTLMSCLYTPDEMSDGAPLPSQPDPVMAHGVIGRFGLHPSRVQEHTESIRAMLSHLPQDFHDSGGSFLNACQDRDGRQWTGLHRTVDELVCLGLAAGMIEFCAPREMWRMLPGGMPYFRVTPADTAGERARAKGFDLTDEDAAFMESL